MRCRIEVLLGWTRLELPVFTLLLLQIFLPDLGFVLESLYLDIYAFVNVGLAIVRFAAEWMCLCMQLIVLFFPLSSLTFRQHRTNTELVSSHSTCSVTSESIVVVAVVT